MGAIAFSSPFSSLTDSLVIPNQGITGFAQPMSQLKYSGSTFDFIGTDNGNALVGTFSSVPTDAVGIEVWVNGNAADDYLFWASTSGILSGTGTLATNITDNLATNFVVASGNHAVIPFVTVGTVPSTLRFAVGKTGARVQGRYVSQASGFPYLLATNIPFELTGAGAAQAAPTGNATFFPSGYCGLIFRVSGTTPARMTMDSNATPPTATVGDILPGGTYYIDQARHGVSLAALRFYLATGTNIQGIALAYA